MAHPPAAPVAPEALPPCDLVLRGGITSGVVYPGAIAELGRRFRFVSIGGASAGAIAAGVAAAAEYGRQKGGVKDPFGGVEKLAGEIGSGEGLRRLFLPGPHWALRVLGAALWGVLGLGKAGGLAALGLAAAAAVWALTALGLGLAWALLALIAGIAALAWWMAARVLPASGFGLCGGIHPRFNRDAVAQDAVMLREQGALMDWLHATVQRLAGRRVGAVPPADGAGAPEAVEPAGRPLTMRDLWGGDETAPRGIDLLLTTTNLSQQLGHQFPFLERTGAALYFDPEELRRLLPRDVVRWMEHAAPETPARITAANPRLRRLPRPADLPVILGVRLSLSFPGLIAAVPLHAEDRAGRRAGKDAGASAARLRRCWFSDGGITSNFPIHVFDGPLPRRPTFCVNLRPATEEEAALGEEGLVQMARTNAAEMAPRFLSRSDGTLLGFAGAIVDTARNAHENEMMLTPGQRDRIVHVMTCKGEGGLNLRMDAEVIDRLSRRGSAAGRRVIRRFHPSGEEPDESPMGWNNQRWIRLRALLAAQERLLADVADAWRHQDPAWGDYATLRRQWSPADPANKDPRIGRRPVPGYPWRNIAASADAGRAVDDMLALADWMRAKAASQAPAPQAASVLDGAEDASGQRRGGAPRPKGGLRMRPISADPRGNLTWR